MIRKCLVILWCLMLAMSSALADGGQIPDGRWLCSDIQGNVTADTPADVKNDFAIYVNKDWILQATIPEGESSTGATADIARKLKDRQIVLMKNTDMPGHDAELIRKLYTLISDWDYRNAMGTEPIMPEINALKAIESMDSLLAFLESEDRQLNILPIDVEVSADYTNPDIYITMIASTELLLGDSAEYTARTQAGDLKYREKRETGLYILQRLGFSEEETLAILENGMAFETKMAEHIKPNEAQYQANFLQSILNYYSEEELISLAGAFPIMNILKAEGLSGGKRFLVAEPDYISALQTFIVDENVGLIRDWLIMKTAITAASYLDQETVRQKERIVNEVRGITGERNDDDVALEHLTNLLNVPMDNLYIQAYCTEKQKEDILKIVSEVTNSYREMLAKVEWLSETTREKAIEKLDCIRVNAVYPDKLGDWSGLDFAGVEENGNLLEAKRSITKFTNKLYAARIDQPVDKDGWDQMLMKTAQVNAFYDPQMNSINIMAGILMGEVYNEEMSEAQILGGIGTIIGHEISHAFDTQGSQFDKDGAVANWWTEEDYTAFQNRAAKLAAWYDGFIPFENANFSGQKVQAEVIADMAGMKCILEMAARKPDFDYDTFFRQYATSWREQLLPSEAIRKVAIDEHPMHYMRANATPAQYDDFVNFYDIQPGDGMYIAPEDRVAVW